MIAWTPSHVSIALPRRRGVMIVATKPFFLSPQYAVNMDFHQYNGRKYTKTSQHILLCKGNSQKSSDPRKLQLKLTNSPNSGFSKVNLDRKKTEITIYSASSRLSFQRFCFAFINFVHDVRTRRIVMRPTYGPECPSEEWKSINN